MEMIHLQMQDCQDELAQERKRSNSLEVSLQKANIINSDLDSQLRSSEKANNVLDE